MTDLAHALRNLDKSSEDAFETDRARINGTLLAVFASILPMESWTPMDDGVLDALKHWRRNLDVRAGRSLPRTDSHHSEFIGPRLRAAE